MARDIMALSFTHVIFALMYYSIYPLHVPISGYFMIESIPTYFWFLYMGALVLNVVFLSSRISISRHLRASLTYMLLYLCSLRTFASLHFTGFTGSDSPNYFGLTQYWVSRENVDLSKVGYGDNPGLFILGKVFVSITGMSVNLYTLFIGIVWITMIYFIFKLITLRYINYIKINYISNNDCQQISGTIAPLIATLSYFGLAVPFMVNFQYAPQTPALVLLLLLFWLMMFPPEKQDSKLFVIILITYFALQFSHPFMFLFAIIAICLLIIIEWLNRLKRPAIYPNTRIHNLTIMLLAMIMLSLFYILYQTILLRRRVGEAIKNMIEAYKPEIPVWHLKRLVTPASPHESGYYIIAVVHSITWIIITLALTFFIMRTLRSKDSKHHEFSIILSSIATSSLFLDPTLQEFTIRIGQVLLFGAILLAVKNILSIGCRSRERVSHYIMWILFMTLVISSFLAFIRYTWYTQPPHVSPHDMSLADTLGSMLDNAYTFNLMSKKAFSEYYCSRNYGHPLIFCRSPVNFLYQRYVNLEKYELILYDQLLDIEFSKYIGDSSQLNVLLNEWNVVINTKGVLVIKNMKT